MVPLNVVKELYNVMMLYIKGPRQKKLINYRYMLKSCQNDMMCLKRLNHVLIYSIVNIIGDHLMSTRKVATALIWICSPSCTKVEASIIHHVHLTTH